ncbi:MAG: GNAT family N-acetyltransferase [Rhodobacteraceae bacterium]|nr:GNAT family N-acetyltransferase [Paracoccaceae bacterium]
MPDTTAFPAFRVSLATTAEERRCAQQLRYQVFVQELGAGGAMVDHSVELEQDAFDAFADHMLVHDTRSGRLAGVYRLLRSDQADRAGGFYSESEYDLGVLTNCDKPLLELGRSCLHPDFRGTTALYHLWGGLAGYVADHQIDILFGVASFHGTNPQTLAAPLSLLHHNHLAPPALRVRARADHFQPMDLTPMQSLDRRNAMIAMPPLIKAYLRLGGSVGEGAYVDHAFNTTDVCLILQTCDMNRRQAQIYAKGRQP